MAVKVCLFANARLGNKKSIFGGFGPGFLFIFLIIFGTWSHCAEANSAVSCKNVTTIFENKGLLTSKDLQATPNTEKDGLCLNEGCCGSRARGVLMRQGRAQLEKRLRAEINKLADTLNTRAVRFDEFFRRLLRQSKAELHAMFKRTYGMIYEQHSYVFGHLYEELERYYVRGDIDLVTTMNHFFKVLYEKMFTVLNSQYTFSEKYLKCVNELMREMKPFDDVPHKLSVQLRRAFVATRTFHKALRRGADIAQSMLKVGVSSSCVTSWARMRWCGACSGEEAPPCSRYCHNVLHGCLASHADLAASWDAYVDAVEKVADRLLGSFNIVMVVEPIDIKISEAIMNFQEHNQDISQNIFSNCGKPVLGGAGGAAPFFASDRSRRSPRSIDFDWQANNDVDDFELETSFESILNENPTLLNVKYPNDMPEFAEKMRNDAVSREEFLKYMRGEIDLEEYSEHVRRRRDAAPATDAADIHFKAYDFDNGGKKKGNKKSSSSIASGETSGAGGSSSEWRGPELERVVKEARARLRNSRRYWEHLPYMLCSDVAASPAPSAACFNGTQRASYTLSAASPGTAGLASNPEVSDEATVSIATQQEDLKLLTARLKDAYNGAEVHWTDDDDLRTVPPLDIDRLGSGSGSGDYDLTDDDEDSRQGGYYPGSGNGPAYDDDDEDSTNVSIEKSTEARPPQPIPDVPFTPMVVSGGESNRNVRIGTSDTTGDTSLNQDQIVPRNNVNQDNAVSEQPVQNAADQPSLQKALFTYALPVVCAWFGTIVTDLF